MDYVVKLEHLARTDIQTYNIDSNTINKLCTYGSNVIHGVIVFLYVSKSLTKEAWWWSIVC